MIIKLTNRLISNASLKLILLILFNALFFLFFSIALAVADDVDEAIDSSGIDTEIPQSEDTGIFDMLFNKLGQSSDEQSNLPAIQDEEIRIYEHSEEGAFLNSARINVIDKTLGKLYPIDINVDGKKSVNEISIKVSKCWAPKMKTIVPEGRAFIEVSDTRNNIITKLFKGWVYAQSASASQLSHPKYDITLAYCKDKAVEKDEKADTESDTTQKEAESSKEVVN